METVLTRVSLVALGLLTDAVQMKASVSSLVVRAALDAGAAETVVSVAKAELVSRENAMATANSSAPIRVCLFIV